MNSKEKEKGLYLERIHNPEGKIKAILFESREHKILIINTFLVNTEEEKEIITAFK